MADPIDDQVNFIIDDIDAAIEGKYPYKLRDILERPADFRDRSSILPEIDRMKGDVDAYFKSKRAELSDMTDVYKKEAAKASSIAQAVGELVKNAARDEKKPLIRPITFVRKDEDDEIIFIDRAEESLPKALAALAADALFVADLSMEVDGFKVGRWVFPGSNGKNRGVFVAFPVNPSGAIDITRDQLELALDAVKDEITRQLTIEGKRPVSNVPATPPGKGAQSKK